MSSEVIRRSMVFVHSLIHSFFLLRGGNLRSANYVVQLATVIPMTLEGRLQEVSILDQTPHSLFWNFDALGYIFMGLATLFALPAFTRTGMQLWVRRAFLANGLVTLLIAFVYFYPTFTEGLLMLGLPWAITAPASMLLLALMFRRESRGLGQGTLPKKS